MNKAELIDRIAQITGNKKTAETVLHDVFGSIMNAVAEGDKVQIIGFGTFEGKERAARIARNPQTGEPVSIPSRVVPAFKPGKHFKDIVNK